MTTARTVLVTGAGGGMSRGINRKLAEAGHRVICADLSADAAEAAASALRGDGADAVAYPVDVTDAADVRRLAADCSREIGAVDAVVNAVGMLDRRSLSEHDDDSFARILDVNLVGPFRVVQAFSPAMVERGWGRIVNISSIAGVTGYPYPGYAASKAGLSNLTRSLVVDFWGSGVTVNAICPGVVDTPMVIDAVRDQVMRKVPTQQIIDPDEIGAAAVFLLSDDARSINGAELLIDGGATRFFQLLDR